jgi:hypothetical protein
MFATTIAGGQLAATAPDVCKTIVGTATVPVPYPVTGMPSGAMPVTKKVFIVNAPALNLMSKVNPTMGPIEYLSASPKVFLEGAPAVRLSDSVTLNNRNTVGVNGLPSQTKVMLG